MSELIKPTAKNVEKQALNYLDAMSYINKKYGIEVRDYHKTYKDPTGATHEYLDYWHWITDHSMTEVRNDTYDYWNLKDILDSETAPHWVKEITQLCYDEFEDELDKDGGVEVWISW